MTDLADGLPGADTLRGAYKEQSGLYEEAATFFRFLRVRRKAEAFSGRAETPIYNRTPVRVTVSTPTQADLQLFGGLYQQGDVKVSTRFEVRGPSDQDGYGGDQFEVRRHRWRVIGRAHAGYLEGSPVVWHALLRRI